MEDRKAKFYEAIGVGYSRQEALKKAGYKPKSRLSASSFAYKLLQERNAVQSREYGPIPTDLPGFCNAGDIFPWNPRGQWVRFSNGQYEYRFPKGSGAGAFSFEQRMDVIKEEEEFIAEFNALKTQFGPEGMAAYHEYCRTAGYLNLSEWVAAGHPMRRAGEPPQGMVE
jgi:hypothetical protein